MGSIQHQRGGYLVVPCPVTLSSSVPANAIADGDPVAMASNFCLPASAFTWTTDLATTQTDFAAAFRGISSSRSRIASTDARDLEIMVNDDVDGEFIGQLAASATLHVGDYVGPAKASGNALLNTLVKVASKALAIGVVTREIGAAATYCYIKLVNTPAQR